MVTINSVHNNRVPESHHCLPNQHKSSYSVIIQDIIQITPLTERSPPRTKHSPKQTLIKYEYIRQEKRSK